ncbi:MAG: glycosyltransferase family 2 protein [Alphaproteobacteria bacterium]|nr:glycosyltransferase family 2 protein [Alphaproteobacteria bacterium]
MPEISVIMPVYNTNEDYFREAIESVLGQSFRDFEFIIVDDCSKKYIEDIVLSYSDERICYYRLAENSGAAAARNFALSKASGKYVAFMDSDDVSLPERLEKQYAFFRTHPEIGCLGTKVEIFGGQKENMFFPKPVKHQEIEEYLLFFGCVFCQSSVMVRKEILDKNNIVYKTEYVPAEDYGLWLDLIGKTKFEVLPEILVKYRFYAENISNVQNKKQREKCLAAQISALEKYCGVCFGDKEILASFFRGDSLAEGDDLRLYPVLRDMIEALDKKGVLRESVCRLLRKRFKKFYYHTRSLSGQWGLLRSPLNGLLRVSLAWRVFCLITRGVF